MRHRRKWENPEINLNCHKLIYETVKLTLAANPSCKLDIEKED